MKSDKIKKLLYEYLTRRLDERTRHEVEAHLKTCSQCRHQLEALKETVSLLDQWKPPEVSPDFEKRVLNRIEEYERKMKEDKKIGHESWIKNLLNKIRDYMKLPVHIKRPLEGLAVVALLLLIFAIYRGIRTKKDSDISLTVRSIVKTNYIIETKDIDAAYDELKEIIESHGGTLIFKEDVKKGVQVTFCIKKEMEDSILNALFRLGKLREIAKADYKNQEVHITLELQKQT